MLAQSGQQMTTDRTAIGRWLAVGGATHRPPRRGRKARHRSIVAPLAATAAVGLGVVLARAEGQRRQARRRRAELGLGLSRAETLPAGLRRMALAQADLAIEHLQAPGDGDGGRAVHEVRKAIKRLRTIVRLLEGQLGPVGSAREHATLRAAAAGLAEARDAEVMLNTLEGLLKRHPKKLGGKGVRRLRRHLAAERDRARRRALEPANRLRVEEELRTFRVRAAHWELHGVSGARAVDPGLRLLYAQGRRRMVRAAGRRGTRMQTMHDWRKRVKDLRYAVEALERSTPEGGLLHPGKRRRTDRARAEARWLHGVADRADKLGELLGEEHDLAVLGQWVAEHGARAGAGRATRRRLRELIRRRRAELRRRALRKGRKLYSRKPRKFLSRVGRAYARCATELS
jgi:CHAD domain-containing protein